MYITNKKIVLLIALITITLVIYKNYTAKTQQPKKIVVIGTGAAGIGFVTELINQNSPHKITWISTDQDNPYNRTKLASIISNKNTEEKTFIFKKLQKNIHLLLGKEVIKIDAEKNSVHLNDGTTHIYDYLFLATGSTPNILPQQINNNLSTGIFNFYTLDDARHINDYIKQYKVKNATIVGCGINGLEVADALHNRGIHINLIDRSEHILHNILDNNDASSLIENNIKKQNVAYYPKSSLKNILQKDGRINTLELDNGTHIATELIIITIGVTANLALAKQAGLAMNNDALIVDIAMRTSNSSIYAGGDIVLVFDQGTKTMVKSSKWGDAMKQGKIAALQIMGNFTPYEGAFIGYKTSFLGNEFFMSGIIKDYPKHYRALKKSGDDFYHCLIVDGDLIKGFYLINHITQARRLRRALKEQTPF